MAEVKTFSCDVCGKLKQKSNHWFVGFVSKEGTSGTRTMFSLMEWAESAATARTSAEVNHLCGMECAHKAMEKALKA